MDPSQALRALEQAGTAQNRKVYGRHGVRGEMYGVSYAELGKLAKRIGRDHALARELWATGNHDARLLATKVADPEQATLKELEAWLRDVDNYPICDALSAFVARTPHAPKLGARWRRAKKEYTAATGWNLAAGAALGDPELDDDTALEQVAAIEQGIHAAPNRVRHAMNAALIALGVRNERLREAAVAAAGRIGKVEVDHGDTSCKTPDAAEYIARTLARRRAGTGHGRASSR